MIPSVGPTTTVGSVGSVAPGAHTPGVTSTVDSLGLTRLVRVTSRVFKPSTVTWALLASGTPSATPVPENTGSPKLIPATVGIFSVNVTTVPLGTLFKVSTVPSPLTDSSPVRVVPLYW